MPGVRRSRRGRSSSAPQTPPRPAPEPITEAPQAKEAAAHLAESDMIAFDTEFLREKTFYPQLGLIQLADREQVWLVDPLALSKEEMGPILEVLTNKNVIKVLHAAEQDQECLNHEYDIVATPILDTSIAAALTGRGDQIGLGPLLHKTLKVDVPKGHSRTNWLKRPLPPAMLEYAASDVLYLVELAERLLSALDRRSRRSWAMSLSAELAAQKRYQANGEAVARKLAQNGRMKPREYEVLKRLASWRESRVRGSDIPRRWLAEDQALVQLARAQPQEEAELSHFRGLGNRVRDYGPKKVLAAIGEALAVPDGELETPPKKLEHSPREASALTALKCFLNFMALENDVPLRYLLDNETQLLLLRGEFETHEELKESGLLSEGALELFGEDLLGLLHGKRGLKIDRGKAVIFSVD